jgi:hypothetical protein
MRPSSRSRPFSNKRSPSRLTHLAIRQLQLTLLHREVTLRFVAHPMTCNPCLLPCQSVSRVPAEQSLAAILEQAKSFTSRSLGDPAATTHAAPQRSGAPVSTSKRDAKKSDSKSTDSRTSGWRSRGNDLTQTPASSSNPPEETVPAVMVPTLTLSLPVFAWDADIQNVTPDAQVGSATNDSTESSATSALQSAISAGASGGGNLPANAIQECVW